MQVTGMWNDKRFTTEECIAIADGKAPTDALIRVMNELIEEIRELKEKISELSE